MNIEIVYYYATKDGKSYRNFAIVDKDHDKLIPIRCAYDSKTDYGKRSFADLCNIAVARSEADRQLYLKERAEYRAEHKKQ